jgi:23S rRNA (cytosine1962-C5)-methyltransferase
VVIDWYGGWAVLAVSSEAAAERCKAIAGVLVDRGVCGVYIKTRVRADLRRQATADLAPAQPVVGAAAAESFVVEEGSRRYQVELARGHQTGLFIDQRGNRQRVQESSRDRAVLNLFCYTCSFSVAAALGGARQVVSVDSSKRVLEAGRRNFELNGIAVAPHRFVADDAIKWLARAARRAERFDLIVLDPPSFSTRNKGTFSVASGYQGLVQAALAVLAKQGKMLCVTNHRKTSTNRLRAMVHGAARELGRQVLRLETLKSGLDCPDGVSGPEPSKSVWLEVE